MGWLIYVICIIPVALMPAVNCIALRCHMTVCASFSVQTCLPDYKGLVQWAAEHFPTPAQKELMQARK